MKKHWIVLFILVVILGTLAYLSTWTVDKVQVEGCEIVNTQSVSDAMKEEAPLDNTLLLYIKSKMNKLKDLSFVSKMDLELTDKNTVTVTVYEKSIAGCVLYKGDYVYFDKDGIVLDSSKRRVGSAPLIKGLTFTEWSIGKKLPSDDDKKFQTILTITQLVEKYDLEIDGIKFTAENEIVLQHGGITIELGEGEYLAVQMMNLGNILKNLEGMSGTLYMKDFDSENATASFISSHEAFSIFKAVSVTSSRIFGTPFNSILFSLNICSELYEKYNRPSK